MDDLKNDERFSHVLKDARFKKLPKKHVKVKVDKRFESMFNDQRFQVKYKIDKRGRPVDVKRSEDLQRYYQVSESDTDSEESKSSEDENEEEEELKSSEEEVEEKKVEVPKKNKISKKEKNGITADIKEKLKDLTVDYARGEGRILTDSSSDEESSSESEGYEVNFDHNWGELDRDAPLTEDATPRLAICNMDWDRIKALDLMVLFSSFLPSGGLIHSVTVYQSEFGKQRMKEEEEKGPIELVQDTETVDEEEDQKVQMEKLRQYQLNRLKYFYAVMVCDTAATANHIYTECDGLEYESSNNRLDLRFIPEDTTFDDEPREVCTDMTDLSNYKPRLFTTTALTQAKVELTWDETDPNRHDAVKALHNGKLDDSQMRKYLAYSSSEEEEEEDKEISEESGENEKKQTEKSAIDKYKLLLAEITNNEKTTKKNNVDMEITWDLKAEKNAEEVVQQKMKDSEAKTPFQKFVDKRKEKKKEKKNKKKAEETTEAFSDDDVPSDIDLNDPYFAEEVEESSGKKKSKKGKLKDKIVEEDPEEKQKAAELELLMLDEESNDKHFNMKKIQEEESKKGKKLKWKKKKKVEEEVKEDDFKVDVNDERFSAVYSSHLFNIDPSDPQFKATKGTKDFIEEKMRRKGAEEKTTEPAKSSKRKQSAELAVLVKTIKRKTEEANLGKSSSNKQRKT